MGRPKLALPDSFLRLTPGGKLNPQGLIPFRLGWWLRGVEVKRMVVVSGAPGRQYLRTAAEARIGRSEPIPEGVYLLGDSDGPVNVQEPSWGPGLGAVWIGVHPLDGYGPERYIGIHEDTGLPGTAACIGLKDRTAINQVAKWFEGPERPRMLVVDYAFGTVPAAPVKKNG